MHYNLWCPSTIRCVSLSFPSHAPITKHSIVPSKCASMCTLSMHPSYTPECAHCHFLSGNICALNTYRLFLSTHSTCALYLLLISKHTLTLSSPALRLLPLHGCSPKPCTFRIYPLTLSSPALFYCEDLY